MHRLQVGTQLYVGRPVHARIAITRGQLLHHPDVFGRGNAAESKRIKEAIAAIHKKTQEVFAHYKSEQDKIFCLR